VSLNLPEFFCKFPVCDSNVANDSNPTSSSVLFVYSIAGNLLGYRMFVGSTLNKNIQRICVGFLFVFHNVFLVFSFSVQAQTTVPQAGKSGVIEKALEQSRPVFKPPKEQEPPQITIKDSRKLKDPGAGPAFLVKRIEIVGNTIIPDEVLLPIVDIGEETEVTLGVLSLMANEITALYAAQGYLLARAYVPQQELKDGIVKIQVSEGRIGKVEVTGVKNLKEQDFQDRMQLVKEEAILKEQTLEKTLLELNDLLGVQVRSSLRPGEIPGTSDLVLEVTETRPYTFSFDSDNFGSRFTGPIRFGMTGVFGNLLTLGDQFYFRWTRSNFGQDLFSPSYTVPLNSIGTRFKFAYTFSEHELGGSLSALAAGGRTRSWGWEVSHPLKRTRTSQMSIRAGLDIKNFENEQQGANSSKDNLVNLSLGLGGNFSDDYLGRSFYDLKLQWGLKESDTERDLISRAGGRGDVFTTNFSLSRFQSAKVLNSYFILKATGQLNSGRALSAGLTAIGGMGTVRGFPLSEFSGDQGYFLSVEYVVPVPWKVSLLKGLPTLDKILSFNVFLDHGKVFTRDRLAGENDQAITGIGGGFKINIPKKENTHPAVSFALTYGVPTMGSPDPSDRSRGTVYLSGLISY